MLYYGMIWWGVCYADIVSRVLVCYVTSGMVMALYGRLYHECSVMICHVMLWYGI